MKRISILHGGGYVGRELIRLVLQHPLAMLEHVTSRTYADQPLHVAHPMLRGHSNLLFTDPDSLDLSNVDAALVAAEHRRGALTVAELVGREFSGPIVDLSADFRYEDLDVYETLFETKHPARHLSDSFTYGVPEIFSPYTTRRIANPGCFATGLLLAVWPLNQHIGAFRAAVTAITGASGSGTRPKSTTHFPEREGNVRAYKVLNHQHLPEVTQFLNRDTDIAMVPASGPWTRGIWGTVHVNSDADEAMVGEWFDQAYGKTACVRLWPGQLPELRFAALTPYCDVGWILRDGHLVIGFALDNLLKGAASQAIQNLNLLLNWPETTGLLPPVE